MFGKMMQKARYRYLPAGSYMCFRAWRTRMKGMRRGEPELRLLRYLVDSNKIGVDIGANRGVYTYFLSKLCRHVYAYEPHPEMCEFLRRAGGKNVTVREAAVSSASGTAILAIPMDGNTHNKNIATLDVDSVDGKIDRVNVATVSLDDEGYEDVGFIKIDIEGHEQEAVTGARRTIERDRPVLLVEIMPDASAEQTISMIEGMRYRCLVFANGTLQDYRWACSKGYNVFRNKIFLPLPD